MRPEILTMQLSIRALTTSTKDRQSTIDVMKSELLFPLLINTCMRTELLEITRDSFEYFLSDIYHRDVTEQSAVPDILCKRDEESSEHKDSHNNQTIV